jgi:hypothetical protein
MGTFVRPVERVPASEQLDVFADVPEAPVVLPPPDENPGVAVELSQRREQLTTALTRLACAATTNHLEAAMLAPPGRDPATYRSCLKRLDMANTSHFVKEARNAFDAASGPYDDGLEAHADGQRFYRHYGGSHGQRPAQREAYSRSLASSYAYLGD